MSLGEKFASIMQRPGQDPSPKDDVPWYLKYAARILGTVASFVAIFSGVLSCITIIVMSVTGFLIGVWLILTGFIVITIEAPCCCMFIEFVPQFSDWIDKRPYWNRAVAYCGLGLTYFYVLSGLLTPLICGGLMCGTGVLYGMMSVGKKGAGLDAAGLPTTSVGSPQEPVPQGAHHTTLMEDPDVWRPT